MLKLSILFLQKLFALQNQEYISQQFNNQKYIIKKTDLVKQNKTNMKQSHLKQSSRGRIKSQRKLETPINNNAYLINNTSSGNNNINAHSTLIRDYDTKTSINFDRINQLKQKYIKNNEINKINNGNNIMGLTLNGSTQFNQLTPILTIPNINQQNITNYYNQSLSFPPIPGQSAQISDFTAQTKQKISNMKSIQLSNIHQLQKQRQFLRLQRIRQIYQDNINQFRRKAEYTNNNISDKLNYIQQELMKIKNLRQNQMRINNQRQIEMQINIQAMRARQAQILREKQINRQIQAQRQLSIRIEMEKQINKQRQRQKENINIGKMPQSIKVSKVQQIIYRDKGQRQYGKDRERSRSKDRLSDNFETKIAKRTNIQHILIEQSNIKLLGQFKQQIKQRINQQFTIFINRLKDQITLDSDFTQVLLSLSSRDRELVKQIIIKYYHKNNANSSIELNAVMQFFTILPVQFDPLQNQIKTSHNGSIQQITRKLYEFYLKIQQHYRLKLQHKFQLSTLQTLFQQIGQNQITVGHLISYINMRTGKQFRNRALIKLLRRLNVNNYTNWIEKSKFIWGFVHS